MSTPPIPQASSENADSSLDTDESRHPTRHPERVRVKSSKRQRKSEAVLPDPLIAPELKVTLPSNCTIRDCAALKAELCAVLDAPQPVSIDLSGLERIDTAAVQLLCAFTRDRKARALGVTWSGPSAALATAVRLLGLNALLDVPAA